MSATLGALDSRKTVMMLCDVQEKFRPAIRWFEEIAEVAQKLIVVGKVFNVPLIVTEQYPKGLGPTISTLEIAHAKCVVPKTKFSMVLPETEDALRAACDNGAPESVILFGIETHVCIEQTAIDLLERGYKVHVVADATSSRTQEDRLLAFQRLRQIGCFVATCENIVFKLLKDKDHPKFAEVRPLIMKSSPETGLTQ